MSDKLFEGLKKIGELGDKYKAMTTNTPENKSNNCHLCGKTAFECGGYLKRVDEKGVPGIWECYPSCDAKLSRNAALLSAVLGDDHE